MSYKTNFIRFLAAAHVIPQGGIISELAKRIIGEPNWMPDSHDVGIIASNMQEMWGDKANTAIATFIASTPCQLSYGSVRLPGALHGMGKGLSEDTKKTLIATARNNGPFHLRAIYDYIGDPLPEISLSEFVELVQKARAHLSEDMALAVCHYTGWLEKIRRPETEQELHVLDKIPLSEIFSFYTKQEYIEDLYRNVLARVVREDNFAAYPLSLQAILLMSKSYVRGLSPEQKDEQLRMVDRGIKATPETFLSFDASHDYPWHALKDIEDHLHTREKAKLEKFLANADINTLDGKSLAYLALNGLAKSDLPRVLSNALPGDVVLFAQTILRRRFRHPTRYALDHELFAMLSKTILQHLLSSPKGVQTALKYARIVGVPKDAVDLLKTHVALGDLWHYGIVPPSYKKAIGSVVQGAQHIPAKLIMQAEYPPDVALRMLDEKAGETVRGEFLSYFLEDHFAGRDEQIAELSNPYLALEALRAIGKSLKMSTIRNLAKRCCEAFSGSDDISLLLEAIIDLIPHKPGSAGLLKGIATKADAIHVCASLISNDGDAAKRVLPEFPEYTVFVTDDQAMRRALRDAFNKRMAKLSEKESINLARYIMWNVESTAKLRTFLRWAQQAPKLSKAARMLVADLNNVCSVLDTKNRNLAASKSVPARPNIRLDSPRNVDEQYCALGMV